MRYILLLPVAFLSCVLCFGQNSSDKIPPAWLHNTPVSNSNDVEFVGVSGIFVQQKQGVAALALDKLAQNLPRDWNMTSTISNRQEDRLNREGGSIIGSSRSQTSIMEVFADGEPVTIRCKLVDEYWKKAKHGTNELEYSAVYQVARYNESRFLETTLTTNYGLIGLWRSALIPGWGQMYKGTYVKGGLIMGGTVGLAAGIVIYENLRSAYVVKASSTHSTTSAKQYQASISNATISRNVCIGGLAALYLFNVIDALVAPGARRIVVSPAAYGNGGFGVGATIDF